MSTPSSSSKKPLTFSNVVSSVQSTFLSKPQPQPQSSSTSKTRSITSSQNRSVQLDPSKLSHNPDEFPQISQEKLQQLFPILISSKESEIEAQKKRLLVREALDEMELHWKLDTKPLGERSATNRGTALLISLLQIIELKSSNDPSSPNYVKGSTPGVESEFLPEILEISAEQALSNLESSTSTNLVKPQARAFETHDVLRAIDRKDHETLLAIRNSNFDLLLDLSPGGVGATTSGRNTPLQYSISLGRGNESTSIILIGILSKFVNTLPDLEDDDVHKHEAGMGVGAGARKKIARPELDSQTLNRLRKLKVNLKLAIDSSILNDQTGLLASYMQVLVMSEGTTFIHQSIQVVSRSLQARLTSRSNRGATLLANEDPIKVATDLVLRFVTESLKARSGTAQTGTSSISGSSRVETTASRVASVDDYVSNSIGDLLMMSLWNLVKFKQSEISSLGEEQERNLISLSARINLTELSRNLPTYFFARDDRVSSHFVERIEGIRSLLASHEPEEGRAIGIVKKGRNNGVWRKAEGIVGKLEEGSRRLSSGERLQVLERLIMN